jgi:hypothetical protein
MTDDSTLMPGEETVMSKTIWIIVVFSAFGAIVLLAARSAGDPAARSKQRLEQILTVPETGFSCEWFHAAYWQYRDEMDSLHEMLDRRRIAPAELNELSLWSNDRIHELLVLHDKVKELDCDMSERVRFD